MNLKCEKVLRKPPPCSLQHFALAAWINGRKNWDPELGLHLCKVSRTIRNIIFNCTTDLKNGGIMYTYNNLSDIIEWEKRHGQIQSIDPYSQIWVRGRRWLSTRRWLNKGVIPRAMVTVKLQDEIEMDEYPHKKVCNRLFTD